MTGLPYARGGEWIEVSAEEAVFTDRLDVPGGWIYRSLVYKVGTDDVLAVSMVFVPEPEPIT